MLKAFRAACRANPLQYGTSNRQAPTRQGQLDLDFGSMTLSQDIRTLMLYLDEIPGTYISYNCDAVHAIGHLVHSSDKTGTDVRAKAQSKQCRSTQQV